MNAGEDNARSNASIDTRRVTFFIGLTFCVGIVKAAGAAAGGTVEDAARRKRPPKFIIVQSVSRITPFVKTLERRQAGAACLITRRVLRGE
jgi:hypothetical protein